MKRLSKALLYVVPLGVGLALAGPRVYAASGGTESSSGATASPMMRAGQAIYADECAACHTAQGTGVANLFPALKGNAVVLEADPTGVINTVLEGGVNPATLHVPTGPAMPAMGWKLSNNEVAAVLTYVRKSWGNAAPAVSASAVHAARAKLCTSVAARMHAQPSLQSVCGPQGTD